MSTTIMTIIGKGPTEKYPGGVYDYTIVVDDQTVEQGTMELRAVDKPRSWHELIEYVNDEAYCKLEYCPGCGIELGYGHKEGCTHANNKNLPKAD